MSFHKNSNEYIELDSMRIKFHLNASLDMDNIHASEELIQKTLKAVKEHSAVSAQTGLHLDRKGLYFLSRYAYRIGGIVAAVILVIAGFGMMKNLLIMGSKGSPNSMISEDMAPENAAEENFSISDRVSLDAAAKKDGAGADSGTSSYTFSCEQAASDADSTKSSRSDKNVVNGDKGESLESAVIVFTDICMLTPKECENIEITDEREDSFISIEDQASIEEFFGFMKGYTYREESDNARTEYFNIKLSSLDPLDAVCNISIGDTTIVQHKTGDTMNESFYAIADYEVFKKDLEEFYLKYKK